MIYHIVAYTVEDRIYGEEFVIHLLHNKLENFEYYYSFVNKLVKNYTDESVELRYVGIEGLELDLNIREPTYLVIADREEILEQRGNIEEVNKVLAEYKKSRITVDYDNDDVTRFISESLLKLAEMDNIRNVKLLRTRRGCHLRIQLQRPISFEEKLRVRDTLGDDFRREAYDRELYKLGLEGFTDVLFNKKVFKTENGYDEYEEKEMLITELKFDFNVSDLVKATNIVKEVKETQETGFIEWKAVLKQPLEISSLLQLYKNSLRKEIERLKEIHKIKQKVLSAYTAVTHLALKLSIDYIDVDLSRRIAIIRLPKELQEFAGRLIGKGGEKVKKVQEITGMKIKILTQ